MNKLEQQLAVLALAARLRAEGLNYRQVAERVGRTTSWVYQNFGPSTKRPNETRGRKPKDKQHVVRAILKDRVLNVPVHVTCARLQISKSYYQYLRRSALGVNPTKGRPRKVEKDDNQNRKPVMGAVQASSGQLQSELDMGQALRDETSERSA